MKYVMLFVCMLSFFELKAAQKYFILDEKSPQYQLARVQLKSSNDQPIALYNLMFEKSNLILFSLLPLNSDELVQYHNPIKEGIIWGEAVNI